MPYAITRSHAFMSTKQPCLASYWVNAGKREENAMKQTMIALASILMVGLLAAASASAEPVSKRLQRQKMRIHRGVSSGALTADEWQRLIRQHRKIRYQHRRAWQDGYLSYQEGRHLHARLDRASRKIHRLKNNHHRARGHHHPHRGPRAW
jgi:hypothetical protein